MPITDWSVLRPNLPPVRVASGPESAKATDKLRLECENRDAWPFPWVYPPPNSERRNPMGFALTPAVAATAEVLAFTVDQGYQFEMLGLSITRNLPTTGTVPLQGSPLADLQNIPFPLGNPQFMPFPLPRSENFGPTDVIRATVLNVSGGVGAPNFALAMFCGWLRKT
jgi:hypothetical protein